MTETQNTTLTIAGQTYPIRFPMGALTRIMRTMNVDTEGLQKKATSSALVEVIEFTQTVAWSGLLSGAKAEGKPATFATPADLAESVESMDELTPALQAFSKAWARFTGADEPQPEAEGEQLPPPVTEPAAEG